MSILCLRKCVHLSFLKLLGVNRNNKPSSRTYILLKSLTIKINLVVNIKAQRKASPPSGATIREVDEQPGFHLPRQGLEGI